MSDLNDNEIGIKIDIKYIIEMQILLFVNY